VRRLVLFGVAGSLSATALLAVGILLFGDFGEREGRILLTTVLLAGYGLLALPAAYLIDRRSLPALATAVVALSVLGFALALAAVWAGDDPPEGLWKTLATVTAFAVAATQTAALARRPSRLFATSTLLVLVLAAMASAAAWAEIESTGYYRALGALAVLDVLAVALQPILGLARRPAETHRLVLVTEPGGRSEASVEASDFATAVERAVRAAERDGRKVVRVERLD
jgi:hypothetical protein